ncbi:hypothetical protein RJ641_008420 [Dillenia turbinata]|uniref:Ring/U-Box superfamily protein n=1 Tax=Dillenia turbinata TaxID=194707 RepID=A0AAN8Z6H5_9MAGN
MALAGLQTVSMLDSSFMRDSSQTTMPMRHGEQERPNNHASSLLQMWRDLEDEHLMNRSQENPRDRLRNQRSVGSDAYMSSPNMSPRPGSELRCGFDDVGGSENEFMIWSQDSSREQSPDIGGEGERERVRQIARGWVDSGTRGVTRGSSSTSNSFEGEWLGQTELERVRIVREWVQMTSQQRGSHGDTVEEQAGELGALIERVRDGLVVNNNRVQPESVRRRIRRVCGRQALLDLLKRNELERQRELQGLSEHRVVSNFAHRNRIQSLLRGRFLRNERMAETEKRPTSVAASELGLLRKRHTVSGLREGFLSGAVHGQMSSNHSDSSSQNSCGSNRDEETQTSISQEIHDHFRQESVSGNEGRDVHQLTGPVDVPEVCTIMSWQEPSSQEEGRHEVHAEDDRNLQNLSFDELNQQSEDAEVNMNRDGEEPVSHEQSQETLESASVEQGPLLESPEVHQEQFLVSVGDSHDYQYRDPASDLEAQAAEITTLQEPIAQGEEQHGELPEERSWQQSLQGDRDEIGADFPENSATLLAQESFDIEGVEQDQELESHEEWGDGHSQDGMGNWLAGTSILPSSLEAVPIGRAEGFYLPVDDNVYSRELRELLRRRSVSNLLRSSFRDSLDQLIQSYVERQGHDTAQWEPHEGSAVPSLEQDQEQQSGGQNEGDMDAGEEPLVLPSMSESPRWEQELPHANWPRHMHQHLEIFNQRTHSLGQEWEIVNDLRIDMARLQQRMNNMQRMLEACMEMQLELQRSVRQEVSAALNRSTGPSASHEEDLSKDGSKWDHIG